MSVIDNLYLILAVAVATGSCISGWTLLRHEKRRTNFLQQEFLRQQESMEQIIKEAANARQEAASALLKAEAASAVKSDFLANTSHEIRTPMNAILGMTRLLLDTPLTDEQQSWAKIVRDSGENLLAIINDILDLSKIEAGGMTLAMAPFNLYQAMAEVTDLLILKTEQKNVSLIVDIDSTVPRRIVGDIVRIKQIVLNLMSNAKKFTAHGYVKLTICKNPANKNDLLFSIEDTGIGIPADKLDHIFEKFTQAEGSTMRRFGGTGLGLPITKELVTLMKGSMEVRSTINQGSCFSFSIPLTCAEPCATQIPTCILDGKHMLIFTDNPMIKSITEKYARNLGLITASYTNSFDILQHLQESAKQDITYNFMLVDHSIGGNDLLELVDRIRIYPSCEDIACIAVTMLGSTTTSRLLNSDKVGALLSRPLFPDQFEDTLKLIETSRREKQKTGLITRAMIEKLQNGDVQRSGAKPSFNGANILVVEDIEANQILMAKVLEKLGCTPDTAMSGREAVERFQKKNYDLIFMDGHMPEMDGFEATRLIRMIEKSADKHTIIVALTADAMSGDAEKYIDAGMDDYLNKPVMPERIAAMLGKWIHHQGAT